MKGKVLKYEDGAFQKASIGHPKKAASPVYIHRRKKVAFASTESVYTLSKYLRVTPANIYAAVAASKS